MRRKFCFRIVNMYKERGKKKEDRRRRKKDRGSCVSELTNQTRETI